MILLGAIAVVSVVLINEWGDFQQRNKPVISQETTLSQAQLAQLPGANDAPAAVDNGTDIPAAPESRNTEVPQVSSAQAQLISVKTDTLHLLIDPHGGDIIKVALPQHLEQIDTPDEPFILLNRTQDNTYIAQSGLIGPNGTDTGAARPVFTTAQPAYELAEGTDTLTVDLQLQQGEVTLTKRFTFQRGDYLVNMQYLINNRSSSDWRGTLFAQIKRDSHNPVVVDGFGMSPYLGAAITTPDNNYLKLDFEDLADSDLMKAGGFKVTQTGGWVAMVQHYFLSAWIPDPQQENHFSLRKGQGDIYLMGYTGPQTTVAAGSEGVLSASFYAGPKHITRLEAIAPYLDLTVDYGWLWWIAKPLFYLLNLIHGLLGSWGWSIVALTVLIKAAFYKLSATSYRSMAKMRKFAPEMARMKELYGDDRQKMSQEMMKLYKKEQINPLSGCLPILVQMPVFIALYWVLMESVELRHTPFLWWIQDLSVKDPLFILPVIMGVTMFVQQKLSPTPPDPTQAKIMQMMPIVFTFMFLWFPAGLVLYWVVNNTLSIAQQYFIVKSIEGAEPKPA